MVNDSAPDKVTDLDRVWELMRRIGSALHVTRVGSKRKVMI
jgi:hypothetical protein